MRFVFLPSWDMISRKRHVWRSVNCHRHLKRSALNGSEQSFLKLLVSPHPEMLRICRETGMTAVFLPEFDQMAQTVQNNPHHCYDVAEHTIQALMHSAPEKNAAACSFYFMIWEKRRRGRRIRTAWIIFMDIRRSAASWQRTILRRLKFDNETIDRVVRLVRSHDVKIEPGERNMRFAFKPSGSGSFPGIVFW